MSWELNGNTGIDSTNFLGTIENEPLIIKTHATERLRITPDGQVGIGTPAPSDGCVLSVETTDSRVAVSGHSNTGYGVLGVSDFNYGVYGASIPPNGSGYTAGAGVGGYSPEGRGVTGLSDNHFGVYGESRYQGPYSVGVYGKGQNCGVISEGNVYVSGYLSKAGGGFQIDNPLSPDEKFLNHSFVESPDMKNIYDGVVELDANGEAEIELPAWFEPLNSDFRYQLTPIGAPGPNLYIAEEISHNRFKIGGGMPAMKVSWQVTGIRQDAWAKAHRVQVEEDKPDHELGHYLHPELHGAPEGKSIMRVRYPQPTQQTP